MASEWQTAFVVSYKMPRCALVTAVKYKSLEKLQDFFFKTETKTKQDQMFKTKTKTFIFVLEAPRDQDPGLEDYITAFLHILRNNLIYKSSSKYDNSFDR